RQVSPDRTHPIATLHFGRVRIRLEADERERRVYGGREERERRGLAPAIERRLGRLRQRRHQARGGTAWREDRDGHYLRRPTRRNYVKCLMPAKTLEASPRAALRLTPEA